MTELEELASVLPVETRRAWPAVAAARPADGVLMGGTALAVHLQHRQSRDLDVFTLEPFDPDDVQSRLEQQGRFAVVSKGEGTLNGVFEETKVQVLWAEGQHQLEPPVPLAGLPVGGLADLAATKAKVLLDRGELRDYVDLMAIEQRAHLSMEEILGLYARRYRLDPTHESLWAIARALGHFADVEDDPALAAEDGGSAFDEVRRYWQRRQADVVTSFDRTGEA